jgi:hypothetical protein
LRQGREILEAVTTGAVLDEDEPFRRIAHAMRAVAFGAVNPGNTAALWEMTTALELRELLLMTISTHR